MLIDTVRVEAPIRTYDPSRVRVQQWTDPASAVVTQSVLGACWRLDSGPLLKMTARGTKFFASVELSVPKWFRQSNVTASSLDEVQDCVRAVMAESREYVQWDISSPADFSLNRLDVVRDMDGVSDIPAVLDALHKVPVPRVEVNHRYADDKRGRTETLVREVQGVWRQSAYDKAAEQADQARRARTASDREYLLVQAEASRGRLRCETALRTKGLRRNHVHQLRDLHDHHVAALSRKYFDRCGFGTTLTTSASMTAALDAMLASEDAKHIEKVIGTVVLDSRGRGHGASHNSVDDYRRLARKYGITAVGLLTPAAQSLRLDFDLGRQVAA